ncbi:diguanylate cyclase [Thiomicrorhabdus heinhorstiae]|uniref:diguanylate cyclase n=1 Tax=Thiomicrorhabdus heinhorstiae TaxID=2748010 RepID=A0ABS0BSV1_9GAMM|nr:diguanylate cyclase [Thiomicrorhabdus heinhorstiae]MBF6056936.1 diguanylate cyclase [Thiomicrorhabdus heinhorstiae]
MSFRHSIALHLLAVIFGFYFLVAVIVTVVQLYKEYENTKESFYQEIQLLPTTFGQGISDSVWTYNQELLLSILRGVYNSPIVVGIEVKSLDHKMDYKIGSILDEHNQPVYFDTQGNPGKSIETGLGADALFGYTFPITYRGPAFKTPQPLGEVTIYSNERLVFERVKYGFFLILINSVIKTLALWFIIFYFIKRYLGKPLNEFTSKIKQQDINQPHPITLDIPWSDSNEILLLKDSYNQMIDSVNEYQAALKNLNKQLDDKVKERTHELFAAKEAAEMLAYTDMLTGVKTRRAFFELAELQLKNGIRQQTVTSIIMIDIDHFKSINDIFGHATGDLVLQTFAKILKNSCRANDVIGRLGGEEFAILLPQTGLEGALHLAEKIRQSVAGEKITQNQQTIHFTASFGVTETNPGQYTLEEILGQADQALYTAKDQGRNRVTHYNAQAQADKPGSSNS